MPMPLPEIHLRLQPDPGFDARCKQFLMGLAQATRQTLPGFRVQAFGSWMQGTCLQGAALDVALVSLSMAPSHLESIAVEVLAEALLRNTKDRFEVEPPTRGKPLKILAGDFSMALPEVSLEVNLWSGKCDTGAIDWALRLLLEFDPRAVPFVLTIKNWAKAKDLVGAGSFVWTVLATLFLQRISVLPPLALLFEGAARRRIGPASKVFSAAAALSAAEELRSLHSRFAEMALWWLDKEQRPLLDLWHGVFTSVRCGFASFSLEGLLRSPPNSSLLQRARGRSAPPGLREKLSPLSPVREVEPELESTATPPSHICTSAGSGSRSGGSSRVEARASAPVVFEPLPPSQCRALQAPGVLVGLVSVALQLPAAPAARDLWA